MREIKFRAWDKKYKDMVLWDDMQRNKRFAIDSELDSDQFIVLPRHENVEIMQYTGLKDKSNKEIYESDIIQDEEGDTYLVYWNEKQAAFRCDLIGAEGVGIYDEFSIEDTPGLIIGNSHETPELLTNHHTS